MDKMRQKVKLRRVSVSADSERALNEARSGIALTCNGHWAYFLWGLHCLHLSVMSV